MKLATSLIIVFALAFGLTVDASMRSNPSCWSALDLTDPVTRIEYEFKDSSIEPVYQRNYSITVSRTEAHLVVTSYKKLVEKTIRLSRKAVDNIMRKIRVSQIANKQNEGDNGCTGGSAQTFRFYSNNREIFHGTVSCGTGDLAGEYDALADALKSLFPPDIDLPFAKNATETGPIGDEPDLLLTVRGSNNIELAGRSVTPKALAKELSRYWKENLESKRFYLKSDSKVRFATLQKLIDTVRKSNRKLEEVYFVVNDTPDKSDVTTSRVKIIGTEGDAFFDLEFAKASDSANRMLVEYAAGNKIRANGNTFSPRNLQTVIAQKLKVDGDTEIRLRISPDSTYGEVIRFLDTIDFSPKLWTK